MAGGDDLDGAGAGAGRAQAAGAGHWSSGSLPSERRPRCSGAPLELHYTVTRPHVHDSMSMSMSHVHDSMSLSHVHVVTSDEYSGMPLEPTLRRRFAAALLPLCRRFAAALLPLPTLRACASQRCAGLSAVDHRRAAPQVPDWPAADEVRASRNHGHPSR
eukprot:3361105-Prymnesium_polylepis.1